MIKIRRNVFETNSSSTHSLIICSEKEFNDFKKGDICVDDFGHFITKAEYLQQLLEYINKHQKEGDSISELTPELIEKYERAFCMIEGVYSYDTYFSIKEEHLETYAEDYTTEKGEKIVVFGAYGFDG